MDHTHHHHHHDWSPPADEHPDFGRMDRIACASDESALTRLHHTWLPWQPGTRHPAPQWSLLPEGISGHDPRVLALPPIVPQMVFSPDGRALASYFPRLREMRPHRSRDYPAVVVHALPHGRRVADVADSLLGHDVGSVAFHDGGLLVGLVLPFGEEALAVLDIARTDRPPPLLRMRTFEATAIAAGPHGVIIAEGHRLRRLDPVTLQPLHSVSYGGIGEITRMTLGADRRTLIGINDRRIVVFDGRGPALERFILRERPDAACDAGAFLLADGRHLMCGDAPARVVNLHSGDEVARLPYAIVAASADGQLAAGYANRQLHLLDCREAHRGHVGAVWSIDSPPPGPELSVAISDDGRLLATWMTPECCIHIHRVMDGARLTPARDHPARNELATTLHSR